MVETEERLPVATMRRPPARRRPLPPGIGYALKRAILGPAIPTRRLVHERLGKLTALPIFSSDALSSVAYGTEEILRVLVPAAGVAAFALVLPISVVIGSILAILVFSYRQTIKAYPSAGGAYIVTKDNFGLVPAQVAGVALLTDYVMTVAVSISAGVAAIVSAATWLYPYRVPMAIAFLALLVWGNLRGVKESGRLFAAPTYVFIFSVFSLLAVAAVRLAAGTIAPAPSTNLPPAPPDVGLLSGVALFVVLKALASGTTALTGVEAISNGIPAFRPPEWKNARTTLMIMASVLGTMFLGIGYLVHRLQIAPDPAEKKTVLSMLASAAYGSSAVGRAAFLLLQVATMAVLVLAANTSFADFPRLASFQAGDSFLPRQLTSRGHRLVFSNGILALGVCAGILVVATGASVSRLIPFYAIGVFTSFTMSQAGMAKRHLRLREPGWRAGLVINASGAFATGVVDVVIAVTKFPNDAAIIVMVPTVVWLLFRMNRQYEHERVELEEGLSRFDASDIARPIIVLIVRELNRETIHALQYAKTIRASEIHPVCFTPVTMPAGDLVERWRALGIDVPLEIVADKGALPNALARYVSVLPGEADVNVIIPGSARGGPVARLRRWQELDRLTRSVLPFERTRITVVRDHPGRGHVMTHTARGELRLRVVARPFHHAIIPVDKVDRATYRAVRYAISLGATDVRAVHAAVEHDNQEQLIRRWMQLGVPVPLDVIECWDRNVARSLESYAADLMGKDAEITVVMPCRDYARLRHRLLHDRTSRKIASVLGRYEHVDIAVVPYFFYEPGAAVARHSAVRRIERSEGRRRPGTDGGERTHALS
jgi:amino acid transporter